jgi:cobalamin biosynthesis Mg chelatase CobN
MELMMNINKTIRHYILLLSIAGSLFFFVLAAPVSVSAVDYPCGTYSSGDYSSSPDCPSTPAASPSSSTTSPSSDTSSQTATTPTSNSTTSQTGTNTPQEQATTTKSGWNWLPYVIGAVVILVALIVGLIIRRKKSQNI